MQTIEFLRLVLPESGWYCSHIRTGKMIDQMFHRSRVDMAAKLAQADGTRSAIYYGVSSFATTDSRKQVNVQAVRSLALDVDCGQDKPYPDWKGGLLALRDFLSHTKLPQPTVVLSGNGLHLYWPMDQDLSREMWFDLASRLRNACHVHKFEVDMSKTTDASMILRPVGTLSDKTGTMVSLGHLSGRFTPSSLGDLLSKYQPSPFRKPTNQRTSALLKALGTTPDSPPAQAGLVSRKCMQVNRLTLNQPQQSEPEWYALMGLAAHCEDSDGVAVAWSERHPEYRQDLTLAKMAQWEASTDGPPTCAMFNQMNPSVCNGCMYLGKITSPIQLGAVRREAPAPQIQLPATVPGQPQQTTPALNLPKPYKRTSDGIYMVVDGVDILVCPFDVVPVTFGMSESQGFEVARFQWRRQHVGWQDLDLRHSQLAEGDTSFTTTIGDQGILLSGSKQTKEFQTMLRAYKTALERTQPMDRSYDSLGWKPGGSFVLGNRVISKTSVGVQTTTCQLNDRMAGMDMGGWTSRGTLKDWTAMTDVVDVEQYCMHLFAVLVSLSSPFYWHSLIKGVTVSFYGPSGGGKSLAQYWAQSVWGNPDTLHTKAQFTANALFAKLATYGNLPLTIDEFTVQKADDVGEFLYWVSQGRNKERLGKDSRLMPALSWAAPVILSTNISILSKLDASNHASSAQFMRLLELPVTPTAAFKESSAAGKAMHAHMMANYGTAGPALLQHAVGLGEDGLRRAINDHSKTFDEEWEGEFTGEERFWEATIKLADFAGRTAKELGIINFSVDRVIMAVMQTLSRFRTSISTRQSDIFDYIITYVNANQHTMLRVRHNESDGSFNVAHNQNIKEVTLRFDTYRNRPEEEVKRGYLHLDRAVFRRWLAEKGVDYGMVVNALERLGLIPKHLSGKRISMGRGTDIKAGQAWVLTVDLQHPRLYDLMHDGGHTVPYLYEVHKDRGT